jgi:hypothetical protein
MSSTWTGKTKQGRGVMVHTGDDGHVDRVKVGWRARCANGGKYSSRTIFGAPLDSSSATAFADAGDYRAHPAGYTARIHTTVKGTWSATNDRWHGVFTVRVRVVQDGEVVDTCRVKKLRWSAGPA